MRRGVKGFTLIEVTIILLVLVTLSSILLPMTERFIDLARWVRVREDVGMLAAIIELFKVDTCGNYFKVNGNSNSIAASNRVDLLVGDGNVPAEYDGGTGNCFGGYDDAWKEELDRTGASGNVYVDTIENHLVRGDPYGSYPGDPYRRPHTNNPFECGWRGAYLSSPVLADPWGTRYMINVAFLGPAGNRSFGIDNDVIFHQMDVFVLSAGPDRTVSTPFIVDGVVARNDDQIALVSGSRM